MTGQERGKGRKKELLRREDSEGRLTVMVGEDGKGEGGLLGRRRKY